MQLSHQTPHRYPHSLSCLGISSAELARRLDDGVTCVRYEYCISFVVATIRYQSRVHLSDARELRVLRGVPYSLIALLLGWWGLPWGPTQVLRACWINLCGGVDVTEEIEQWLDQSRSSPLETPPKRFPPTTDESWVGLS